MLLIPRKTRMGTVRTSSIHGATRKVTISLEFWITQAKKSNPPTLKP